MEEGVEMKKSWSTGSRSGTCCWSAEGAPVFCVCCRYLNTVMLKMSSKE